MCNVPDDSAARWTAAMRRGDFHAAWRISDRVLEQHRRAGHDFAAPRHEQWVWDGTALDGKHVLVRCYHGLGDTIMLARLLPGLACLAAHVTVWAQPVLIPLLRTLAGHCDLMPLHDGTPDVDYDVDLESMELLHALHISLDTLPARVPYLHVEPAPFCAELGLLAQAGDWDERRSIPSDLLGLLARGRDAVSFQLGSSIPGTRDASTPDLLELAGRLRTTKLVVTVDTMLAHLAGALGVPTWTLLPFEADWRWMADRTDSPWYPTMRLFRQPRPGDWQSVICQVREALATS